MSEYIDLKPGLLNLGANNNLVQTNLCDRGYSRHCRMFSSKPDLWMPILSFLRGDSPKFLNMDKGPLEARRPVIVNQCFPLMPTIYVIWISSLSFSELRDLRCGAGIANRRWDRKPYQ